MGGVSLKGLYLTLIKPDWAANWQKIKRSSLNCSVTLQPAKLTTMDNLAIEHPGPSNE